MIYIINFTLLGVFMNIFRMSLVMIAVVGSVSAGEQGTFFSRQFDSAKLFRDQVNVKVNKVSNGAFGNVGGFAASYLANRYYDKNAHLNKAGLATLGHAYDKYRTIKEGLDVLELGAHFGIYGGVSYGTQKLNENGITLDAAGNLCQAVVN